MSRRKKETKEPVVHLDLGYTELEIYPNYVVIRTAEGVITSLQKHEEVVAAIESHLAGDYVFILDEVNSYSVELEPIFAIRDNPRIIAVAIVVYRPQTELIYQHGAELIKKPSMFFHDLEQAKQWALQQAA